MKNRFFGDINDFRKYGLLRILAGNDAASASVCWMLTPDDGPHGNHIKYLRQPEKWRCFDKDLFDALHQAVIVDGERNVRRAEDVKVLTPAVFSYWKEYLNDDPVERRKYFEGFLSFARGKDLAFFDPDNGLDVPSTPCGTKHSSKFLYRNELLAMWEAKSSILIYQHFPMEERSGFLRRIANELCGIVGLSDVVSFPTPYAVFFLLVQPHHHHLIVRAKEIAQVWDPRLGFLPRHAKSLISGEVTMKKTQQFLAKLKLPEEDNHSLVPSKKRFPDGGEYRIEIPSVEGPRVFREVLATAKELQVPIHRVSQGSGIMLLTKNEITEMARIGAGERIEVCLFIGPRATFETGGQTSSTAGKVIGLQHRGADQLVYAVEDVRRACELGIRSVLPADLGLIWVLNEMKKKGELPRNLVLKSSVTLPAANPATAKVFEGAGVSTLNIPTDLSPAQIGAIRQTVEIPIDMYIEVPDNFGGFVRYYEMPQLVRVAAPIYFKFGLRNAPDIYPSGLHIEELAVKMGRERVRRASIALDLMQRYAPAAKMSPLGSNDLGIPEIY